MRSEDILERLRLVKYPGFSRDIVSFGLVRTAVFEDGIARVRLALTSTDAKVPEFIKREVINCLSVVEGVKGVEVDVVSESPGNSGVTGNAGGGAGVEKRVEAPRPLVRFAVAVASGKGGVGKSTVAVNLACALAKILEKQGRAGKVGLMDCDVYGPSVPLMLGLKEKLFVEDEMIIPPERHGLKVMSMGFLVGDDTPVVWRGPMIMRTVQQFVQNVKWGELDVLVVDLPPGTGDAQLSLVQTLPLDGVVIVTTPQPAASSVARRGGMMFQKVNVPVLGVVENMSGFVDGAGVRHELFGSGGGKETAEALGTELLGEVPVLQGIREAGDAGVPVVVSGGREGEVFMGIADRVLGLLAKGKKAG